MPARVILSRYFDDNVRLVADMCPKCYEERTEARIVSVNWSFLARVGVDKDTNLPEVLDYICTRPEEENHIFSGFNKEEASEAKQRFDILNRIIQIETSSLKNLRERDSNNNAEEFVGFPPGDLHDSLVDYKKLYRFSKLKIFKPISFDTRSSYFPEKIPGTCTCTPFKPDLDYESEYFKRINLKNYSSTRFTPPRSPHNLIEEVLHHDPWALLVATIFLNRTSCFCARPYVFWFLVENPDPLKVLAKCPRDLEKYFVNLGLQRTRAAQVWRMSRDFVHKHWRSVRELYGIGGYGETAFRMFCQGDFSVEPRDRFLRIYKAWYLKIATKRPPRTYE